jgi:hypothetical protein
VVRRLLHRWVFRRRWLTFVVMGLAFLLFGAGTLNLIHVLQANISFIAEHGVMALADGAALQLLEILVTGYISLLCYLIFKACEHTIVHSLTHPPEEEPFP